MYINNVLIGTGVSKIILQPSTSLHNFCEVGFHTEGKARGRRKGRGGEREKVRE